MLVLLRRNVPPRREVSVSITTSWPHLVMSLSESFHVPKKRMAELVGCAKEWFSFVKNSGKVENGKDKKVFVIK